MRDTLHLRKPEKETSVVRQDEGLPVGPRDKQTFKFVYAHYPKAWIFNEKRGFLPNIKKIKARPGLNGVRKDGSMSLTLARVVEMGGTVLDPKDERLGQYMDYVCFYPIRGGGKYYVDFNAEATVLPNNEVIWNKSEQAETWADFQLFLRDSGIITPLLREVYVGLVEKERNKRDTLYQRLDRNPHLKNRLETSERRLKLMEKAWQDMSGKLVAEKGTSTPSKRTEKVIE
jgi:hypothetical protein